MPDQANQSAAVENLQRYLRRLSVIEPSIPPPPVDGVFDNRTEEALRAYQTLRDLPSTGIADFETWEHLYDDYRIAQALGSPPQRVALFPLTPNNYLLSTGSRGFAVNALQYMLRELQHDHIEFENLPQTGVYDADTAAAVRVFQRKNQIPVDGSVGLLTWNTITDQYNLLFSDVSPD